MKGKCVRALALALAVAASLLGRPAGAAGKDEIVIGMTQFPSTLHPNIDSMLAKSYVIAMTRRPFVVYDQRWRLTCMLCVELPSMENGLAVKEKTPDGKDGVAVTLTIHPAATWGDGTPVTTEDARFTWEVGRHPESGVAGQDFYRRAYAFEAVDDKTFTLHFDKLRFDYDQIGLDLVPAHIERPYFAEPKEYRNRTAFDSDAANSGLYFGPYRITEVASGSHIVLEPNPTWWGPPPPFKRVTVRIIENTAALEANLLSGGIDYIAGELGLTVDQAIAFEKRHGKRFDIVFKPGLIYEHIDLNLANPILADQRVRRALIHAIDRAAISAQLFDGRQPVAHSNVNPLDWIHAEDTPTYAHDPKRAAVLLDAAGWSVIRGGIRHNANGERLTLELMTTAGNRTRELVQQVLQSQWRQVGIDVRIRNEPARVFFGETVGKRKFSAMAMYAWLSAPESVPRTTLHSSEIPTEANNWSGQNYPGFRDPETDSLIEKIEVELNRERRKGLWRRLQHIYAEALPVIPLYFRAEPYIFPKWLKDVEPTGHLVTTTNWIEHWRVER
jgi:peptide/nickel transport system substrate-binding protein